MPESAPAWHPARMNTFLRYVFETLAGTPKDMCPGPDDWRRDPLSHPDLRGMSLRELADLPFDPRDIAPD
ncbi:hypothetical protein [Roseivivax sediminis]|uniref:hypothetical protein n=1 Tax=Roseivivax sediminis TaxID=936889 RepID=UPI00122D2503|nr:hypothetical protein [Roseivivax sediminis]